MSQKSNLKRLTGDSHVYWNPYRKVWWFISSGGIVWERKPGKSWGLGLQFHLISIPASRINITHCA